MQLLLPPDMARTDQRNSCLETNIASVCGLWIVAPSRTWRPIFFFFILSIEIVLSSEQLEKV